MESLQKWSFICLYQKYFLWTLWNCKSAVWTLTASWDEVATFLLHDAVQMGKNKSIMSVTDMTDNIIKPSWLVSWTGLQGVSGIIVKLSVLNQRLIIRHFNFKAVIIARYWRYMIYSHRLLAYTHCKLKAEQWSFLS